MQKVNKTDSIFIAGHSGMVGSAILRKLKDNGYQVLRLREKPLRIISKSDITFSINKGLKSLIDRTLLQINENYKLEKSLKEKSQTYISQSEYQNGKNLEKYISTILKNKE